MVRLTKNYIIRHADSLRLMQFRNKTDSEGEFLAKITHMKLSEKYIDKIEPIDGCNNVTTLYFQNNLLRNIENLDCFPSITHLYLQRNKISKIENLQELVNLKKVYLGYNEISVLEGLEYLPSIKEIHIEFQSLPLGESLYFDPRTIANLSKCLEILNVSGNGLISLFPLFSMGNLHELLAEENKLVDLGQLLIVLSTLPKLERLNLAENPVSSLREFNDAVIFSAKKLKSLNGKEVKPCTRAFIEGWMRARKNRERLQDNREYGDDDSKYQQATARKIVHFTDILVEPKKGGPIDEPLRYRPWQLRANMNGGGIPRVYRLKTKRSEDATYSS